MWEENKTKTKRKHKKDVNETTKFKHTSGYFSSPCNRSLKLDLTLYFGSNLSILIGGFISVIFEIFLPSLKVLCTY